jgi:hypothetical protein
VDSLQAARLDAAELLENFSRIIPDLRPVHRGFIAIG